MIKSHSRESHKDRKPFKVNSHGPSRGDLERALKLREVMEALYEANKNVPVIVEGKKDAVALRNLGLVGEIITLHRGNNLYEFCEDISESFHKVIILLDWDDKGEALCKTLSTNLRGLWEEFSGFREILKILCQKDIKDVEGIPKLLKNLEGDEAYRQ
ncbi:MAG TPA: toprim domain-containing protein [Thermodesulfovibrionales bacterium]|jgi:5S rRNA maturation endonuclease (ribonuclease M5)|nr:toprim domain-containing protein [Thermodesulfovibrionales bacterium]